MMIRELKFAKWTFQGLSIAGVATSIASRELGLAFDVAQGLPHAFNVARFLISHGHMDHAAGIPYLISQKNMYGHPPPTFYMPEPLVEPMHEIMRVWQKIEDHTYRYEFVGAKVGELYELNREMVFKPFLTSHRVASQGYTVYRRVKRLKPEYRDLSPQELTALRRKQIKIEHFELEPQISFTGDTRIDFLDQNPDVQRSKLLFIETTYLDDRKSVEVARQWGHLHLDELIERLPSLQNEKIVLIHVSSRYSRAQVSEILEKRLPPDQLERLTVF